MVPKVLEIKENELCQKHRNHKTLSRSPRKFEYCCAFNHPFAHFINEGNNIDYTIELSVIFKAFCRKFQDFSRISRNFVIFKDFSRTRCFFKEFS